MFPRNTDFHEENYDVLELEKENLEAESDLTCVKWVTKFHSTNC